MTATTKVPVQPSTDLTDRQRQVAMGLEQHLTLKEIAAELGVSESAVNQHVRALKKKLGANSIREIIEGFQVLEGRQARSPSCRFSTARNPHLPPYQGDRASDPGTAKGIFAFQDIQSFPIESPWIDGIEPQVVPRELDGKLAVPARLLIISGVMFASLAGIVLALTATEVLSEMVSESQPNLELINRGSAA